MTIASAGIAAAMGSLVRRMIISYWASVAFQYPVTEAGMRFVSREEGPLALFSDRL